MKLILENWRKFMNESEKAQDYGHLYLFEEDGTIRQTSFYDALNLLNEHENDTSLFLENWEKSVDYQLQQLDEGKISDWVNNVFFGLSSQAFILINKLKNKVVKHAAKIFGVVKKIRSGLERFKEKYPKIYKFGSFTVKLVVVTVVFYLLRDAMGGGEAQAGELMGSGFGAQFDPNAVLADEGQLKAVADLMSQMGETGLADEISRIAENPDAVELRDITLRAKNVIINALEQMDSMGMEADAAGNLVQQAQETVNALPDVVAQVQDITIQNKPGAAMQAVMRLMQDPGNTQAIEILQGLQPDVELLQNVDFGSLDLETAKELAQQLQAVAFPT